MYWIRIVLTGVVFFALFVIGASFELVVKYTRVRDYLVKRFGEKGAYNMSNVLITIACLPCFFFLLYAVKHLTPEVLNMPRGSIVVGTLLIAAGVGIIIYSLRFLKAFRWMGHNIFGFAKEKDGLVNDGPYKYIRHPTYLAMILFCYGIFFIIPWIIILIICISFHVYIVFIHSKVEERQLIQKFGPVYAEYMKQTSGFVPRPWKHVGGA
ncbi:MAG: isoprenylcysteine carboxylmethyltransferase family protein [Theionarchaea archaeon]|nr:isoprenylcysteine carboxylmethyltransferase family protein [Theionarchaea archaeon]